MKKFEVVLLILFLLGSTIYSFTLPDETIEAIKTIKEIVISVEGAVNQKCTFEYNPTVKQVLEKCNLTNEYNFNETITLDNEQIFYIPMQSDNLVSLNTATIEELMSIKGVGEVKANKIIEYRNKQRFELIEDIMKISGIGEKTYYKLRVFLCL